MCRVEPGTLFLVSLRDTFEYLFVPGTANLEVVERMWGELRSADKFV